MQWSSSSSPTGHGLVEMLVAIDQLARPVVLGVQVPCPTVRIQLAGASSTAYPVVSRNLSPVRHHARSSPQARLQGVHPGPSRTARRCGTKSPILALARTFRILLQTQIPLRRPSERRGCARTVPESPSWLVTVPLNLHSVHLQHRVRRTCVRLLRPMIHSHMRRWKRAGRCRSRVVWRLTSARLWQVTIVKRVTKNLVRFSAVLSPHNAYSLLALPTPWLAGTKVQQPWELV